MGLISNNLFKKFFFYLSATFNLFYSSRLGKLNDKIYKAFLHELNMNQFKQGFALWLREVLGKLEYFALLSNKEFLVPGINGIAGLTYLLDYKKSS